MWSTNYTSLRSWFCEHARVGFRAEAPGQGGRAKASEAAVGEALRLAVGPDARFRLILVDKGAEGAVRCIIRPEEVQVAEDSPLAGRAPPPPRSDVIVVARLGLDCHRTSDAAVQQANVIMERLGIDKLDGLCVPWPKALDDAGDDPSHVGPRRCGAASARAEEKAVPRRASRETS